MIKYLLLINYLVFASWSFSQGYKSKSDSYFTVGDSIRVDVNFVFDRLRVDSLGNPVNSDNSIWVKEFLKDHPLIKVSIHCHTDSRGSVVKNQERSERRANSFKGWLVDKGIDPSRITDVKGWGEIRPIVKEDAIYSAFRENRNAVDSLHAINRRITVIIEEVQHVVSCSYRFAGNPELIQYYDKGRSHIEMNDRFRLDFIQPDSLDIINVIEYRKLAEFLRCNPSVKFGISVHELLLKEDRKMETEDTFNVAKEIIELLHGVYDISEDQLQPIGAGRMQPIIPKLVLDQLDSKEEKRAFDAINRRVELVVLEVGVSR